MLILSDLRLQRPITAALDDFLWIPGWLEQADAKKLESSIVIETREKSSIQKSYGPHGPYWNPSKRMVRFGDPDVTYTYKGKSKPVFAWTPSLIVLRTLVEQSIEMKFNCVVVNFYEDEEADLYPHSDVKYIPQLGPEPVIAAVSFGETRDFVIREGTSGKGADHIVPLSHGDLFIMKGKSQSDFRHGLPKAQSPKGRRVSLTFRKHLKV